MNMFTKLIATTAISGLCVTAAQAENVTLRIGAGHPSVLAYVQIWDDYFTSQVTDRAADLGHQVRFISAWGTATGVSDVLEATSAGALDIGLIATVFEPSRLELFNVGYLMPFSSPDPILQTEVANRLIQENPAFAEVLGGFGLTALGAMATENYGMPIRTAPNGIADVAGLRIAAGEANAPWAQAAGGVPVAIPANENYEAISSGLLDANVIFISAMESFRWYELFNAFYSTDFGALPGYLSVMNSETRDELPEDLVALIDQVALETVAELADISSRRDAQFTEIAQGHGVEIVQISAEDQTAWAQAILPGAEAQIAEMESRGLPAVSVMGDYVRYLREAGHEFPVTFSFETQ